MMWGEKKEPDRCNTVAIIEEYNVRDFSVCDCEGEGLSFHLCFHLYFLRLKEDHTNSETSQSAHISPVLLLVISLFDSGRFSACQLG